jgi:UDP:flavonoid glycosyltransferase YjiC (YdhE family)
MVCIAFVALIPDAGHILPLLRIAKALSKYGASIRFYVPEEAERLIQVTEFNFDLLRPVLPKNADYLLKIIYKNTPLSRKLFYHRYFHINYFNPIQYRGLASLPDPPGKAKRRAS